MNPEPGKNSRGPLAFMANNSVAANLLMMVLLIGGLFAVFQMKQEVFPEFDLDLITVAVPYPGASPTDVEQGIVLAVEEAVRGIDGVKEITSTSAEGAGVVMIELLLDADPDRALSDIKSAVDRILTFPEEAERPVVSLAAHRREVVSLLISGDQELTTLHALAEQAREEILHHPNVTQVEVEGLPDLEIGIEISRENLEAYGFTLDQIAAQIKAASLELPSGSIETSSGEVLVRVSDRRLTKNEFSQIILRGTAGGAEVRLGQIATITDGFADTDQASYFNGEPTVRLTVYRIGDETPTEVSEATEQVAEKLREKFPDNISLSVWSDASERLEERMQLLMKNAAIGLLLVLVSLALFLKIRIAFWVAVGIPVSFLGAFLILQATGQSINMVSLFALIITLGMVVDDAIIVGENTFSKIQQGLSRKQAAVEGVREMALPVTFSILTTFAAFFPLFFVPGIMGKIFFVVPIVVVSVLFFSLVESFFIMPSHLSHGKEKPPGRTLQWIEKRRVRFAEWLERFIEKAYRPGLSWVLRHRYIALSIALSQLIIFAGITISGILPFNFFPDVEDDEVEVIARLPFGAPIERTLEVQRIIEKAAVESIEELGGEKITRGIYTLVGELGGRSSESGSHLIEVEVGLAELETGQVPARDFAETWRKNIPPIAGLESLVFKTNVGPSVGSAVHLQLSHSDTEVLAEASAKVATAMTQYSELTSVENGYAAGKQQFDFHLLPAARSLGLTTHDVARQVRSAFYGAEAIREQRGRNEVRIMVRLPEDQRRSEFDLEKLRIRTPGAGMVPLSQVVSFERSRAPTTIIREEGRRVIDVTANLAPGVPSARPIQESLMTELVPTLATQFPGLEVETAGRQREQNESFQSLGKNFMFALFIIFALLAIPLRSYVQPAIIMTAIPFGLIAAIMGHIIMGYSLSIISVLGIVALAGVVVNDTLILVVAANRYREGGMSPLDAITAAGVRRFRPILLTSLTTFFGLAPMIFETSIQAKFLIPMAISLGFGILLSLPIALAIVPAFYMLMEDLLGFKNRLFAGGKADEGSTPEVQ
jgi:multidrug efflux pump subunit AcrB